MKLKSKSGIFWVTLGLALIFLSLLLDSIFFAPSGTPQVSAGAPANPSMVVSLAHSAVKLIDVTGIACLVLGLIHIMIETDDWSEYFRERIREIVMQQTYLNTLDKARLDVLHTSILKAQFGNPDIDKEGGFLNYLRSNLHRYIAQPHREDVTAELIYTDAGEDWDVYDRVTYVCRRSLIGIQPSVTWQVDVGEWVSIEYLKIEIQFPYTHEERGTRRPLYNDKPEIGKLLLIPLTQYQQIDELIVIVTERYKVRKDQFQHWAMADPTRNFDITLVFPVGWEVQAKHFVLSPELVLTTIADGYHKAKYDFWMLPESGMSWLIKPKKPQTTEVVSPTVPDNAIDP
jgi:hypothetical protein